MINGTGDIISPFSVTSYAKREASRFAFSPRKILQTDCRRRSRGGNRTERLAQDSSQVFH